MPDHIVNGGLPARVGAALLVILAALSGAPGGRATGAEPAKRIIINLPACKLYLYDGEALLRQYPVAVGHGLTPTEPGSYRIIVKIVNPGWYPKKRPPVPPGPKNPLGTRWMGLSLPEVGIHGTNNPASIGQAVSAGCIRMQNADVEELFSQVAVGTPVDLVYETLVVDAAHPPYQLTVYPDVYRRGTSTRGRLRDLLWAAGLRPELDESRVEQLIREASGQAVPLPVRPQVVVAGRPARQARVWEGEFWLGLCEAGELTGRPLYFWEGRTRVEAGETWVPATDLAARLGYQVKAEPTAGALYLTAPLAFWNGAPVARAFVTAEGSVLAPVEPLAAAAGRSVDIDPCLGVAVSPAGRAVSVRLMAEEAYLEPERLADLLACDLSRESDGLWFQAPAAPAGPPLED
jgi:hypothetical protein